MGLAVSPSSSRAARTRKEKTKETGIKTKATIVYRGRQNSALSADQRQNTRRLDRRQGADMQTPPRVVATLIVAIAVVSSVSLVGAAVTGGASASAHPGSVAIGADEPTENVTRRLMVYISRGGGSARVTFQVLYPARSVEEAERAANRSYQPAWFDGREQIRRIFDQTADANDSLAGGECTSNHADELALLQPAKPEHGWVILQCFMGWIGFFGPADERVVIDESFTVVLESGDNLIADVPADWTPESIQGDPIVRRSGEAGKAYVWTVNHTAEPPRIVFNRSVLEEQPTTQRSGNEDDSDIDIPLALILLLVLAVGAVYTYQRRKGG